MNRSRRSVDAVADRRRRLAREENRDHITLLRELKVSQGKLDEARDRLVELYDFAPNAYITLDSRGVVLQLNLTAANWLGEKREAIERTPLVSLVPAADRTAYVEFLRRCLTSGPGSEVLTQLGLKTADGVRDVELICRPRSGVDKLFVAMIDITDRRRLELERERRAAQDEERHRIARDLHDNLGQHVTALRLMVQTLATPAKETSVGEHIKKMEAILERLDAGIDAVISELRPEALDLGLGRAIAEFVENWSRSFAVSSRVTCNVPADLRLHPDAETHMYHVLQEALNNVSKHARATMVTVALDLDRSVVVLSVHDDGCGFRRDGDSVTSHRGVGLIGMRERARLAGGTIVVETQPGSGTTIRMRVPLPPVITGERSRRR